MGAAVGRMTAPPEEPFTAAELAEIVDADTERRKADWFFDRYDPDSLDDQWWW